MFHHLVLVAAVVVGTWNGNWFPSGRAEHRAHPDVELATTVAAAKMLRAGLDCVDPLGTNDVILCLNEIRGPRSASNLVSRIGRPGLRVVVVSGYRRRDRFDQQQDVIATTLPVVESIWSTWKRGKTVLPRGYAYASVVIDAATTASVYAVHLKSNYGAKTPAQKAENRLKRAEAVKQLINIETARRECLKRPVIVAGDMNADKWRREFAGEELFGLFELAGLLEPLSLLPVGERNTHPSHTHGDSALDYIFYRGCSIVDRPKIVPNEGLSDHYAIFAGLVVISAGK